MTQTNNCQFCNKSEFILENGIEDKHYSELELSLEKDFPMKFWIGFKG